MGRLIILVRFFAGGGGDEIDEVSSFYVRV